MRAFIHALVAVHVAQLVSSLSTRRQDDVPACDANPHPTCARQAASSRWVVESFDYHAEYIFSTPAHQNSHGYVNFDLWNTAVDYTATCSATSDQLSDFFYGTLWYPCALPSTAPAGAAVSFRFNRPTGELDVNGTILCADNGGAPAAYNVQGTTTLTLACNDTTTITPNWTPSSGQFYSVREVKCAPDTCAF